MRRRFAAALLLCAFACSVPAEQVIISDFFAASRLRDLTALSELSTTIFEPRERGTVSEVRVESVTAERAEGSSTFKDVIVDATLHRPDGSTAQVPLVVTLSRPAAESERSARYGGWKVTAVR